jgi:hypothetical protein
MANNQIKQPRQPRVKFINNNRMGEVKLYFKAKDSKAEDAAALQAFKKWIDDTKTWHGAKRTQQ